MAGRQIGMYNPSSISRRHQVKKGEQFFDRERLARKFSEQPENKWVNRQVEQVMSKLPYNNDLHRRDRSDGITTNPVRSDQRDIRNRSP